MIRRIAADPDITAVAVVLLFSYLNPVHERRLKALFAEEAPGLPVPCLTMCYRNGKNIYGHRPRLPMPFIKPVVSEQLRQMRSRFAEQGITDHVVVIRSNGGEMTLEAAVDHPVQITVSGPTGGVVAAKRTRRVCSGITSLVTLDMGGTSTDCSTVVNGQENFTTNFEIEWGVPIQIPMIDIRTIGAGGGSIAWIDKGGMLVVGPESAGAKPGPACYGAGGTMRPSPTPMWCLAALTRQFPRWRHALDADAASAAVAPIAAELAMRSEAAALAIVTIANNNMVGALHTVLTERGLDPRDFVAGVWRRGSVARRRPDAGHRHSGRHRTQPSRSIFRLWLYPDGCAG